jgi:hypothetical protein
MGVTYTGTCTPMPLYPRRKGPKEAYLLCRSGVGPRISPDERKKNRGHIVAQNIGDAQLCVSEGSEGTSIRTAEIGGLALLNCTIVQFNSA